MSQKQIDLLKESLAMSQALCRKLAVEKRQLTETLVRAKHVLGRNHPVFPPETIEHRLTSNWSHHDSVNWDSSADINIHKVISEVEYLIQMIPISEIMDNERVQHFKVRFQGNDYGYAMTEGCLNEAKLPDDILQENITTAISTMVMDHIKKTRNKNDS